MRLPGPSCAIIALCENPDEMGTPGFWSRWHWADGRVQALLYNVDIDRIEIWLLDGGNENTLRNNLKGEMAI